jgi:hypothetical protein
MSTSPMASGFSSATSNLEQHSDGNSLKCLRRLPRRPPRRRLPLRAPIHGRCLLLVPNVGGLTSNATEASPHAYAARWVGRSAPTPALHVVVDAHVTHAARTTTMTPTLPANLQEHKCRCTLSRHGSPFPPT